MSKSTPPQVPSPTSSSAEFFDPTGTTSVEFRADSATQLLFAKELVARLSFLTLRDQDALTVLHNGREERLTDTGGEAIQELL